jgi:hypothetical protein
MELGIYVSFRNRISDYATVWTSEEYGFDSPQGQEIFLFSVTSRPALEPTQAPIQWVPGVKAGEA